MLLPLLDCTPIMASLVSWLIICPALIGCVARSAPIGLRSSSNSMGSSGLFGCGVNMMLALSVPCGYERLPLGLIIGDDMVYYLSCVSLFPSSAPTVSPTVSKRPGREGAPIAPQTSGNGQGHKRPMAPTLQCSQTKCQAHRLEPKWKWHIGHMPHMLVLISHVVH